MNGRRKCFFMLALVTASTYTDCHGEEPVWIFSSPSTVLFRDAYAESYRGWVSQFSPDAALTKSLLQRMDYAEGKINEKYKGLLGAESWARITHVTSSGNLVAISGWKVNGPESLVAKQEVHAGRIGPDASIEEHDGYVVIRGGESVTMTDGYRDVNGWLPLFLRYHDGWMFQSHSEDFAKWRPTGDLIDRLNFLADKSWFQQSRPTKVSKNARQALLASAFATLGTKQQQLDGETNSAFTGRVAPHVLAELFLRTQFFQTEQITGWRSSIEEGKPVTYFFEVTAERDSDFARSINLMRHRSIQSATKAAWCSAAISFRVPEELGTQLAELLPKDIGDPLLRRLSSEVARSLSSGKLHIESWLEENDEENLLNGVTILRPVNIGRSSVEEDGADTGAQQERSLFSGNQINRDGDIEWYIGSDSYEGRSSTIETTSVGVSPVLLSAKVNLLELTKVGQETKEFDVYAFLQDKYLRYKSPDLPGFRPKRFVLRDRDRVALASLRERIAGDDPDRWSAKVLVTLNSRKRQLAVRVEVGDQLFGFLTIAEKYWERAADAAVAQGK